MADPKETNQITGYGKTKGEDGMANPVKQLNPILEPEFDATFMSY